MNESLEEFYKNLLGVDVPWEVKSIRRNSKDREILVAVQMKPNSRYVCPVCGNNATKYDQKIRRWRHLDSCNHKTLIEGAIPRVKCLEHGVKQLPVSWAEEGSHYTLEFESLVLLWLKDDPISTVAKNFDLTWDIVDGIMRRGVMRGLRRRTKKSPRNIGIDETSFQKRHQYVTVILDKDDGTVIDILDDRKANTLKTWFKEQRSCDFARINSISMDMWDPFINSVREHFERADELIAFDRFHVSQHFGKAVDKVRAEEHRTLAVNGKSPLTRTRHQWLINSGRRDNRSMKRRRFLSITRINLYSKALGLSATSLSNSL